MVTAVLSPVSTAEVVRQHWDVIVVGTGMGGATLGYRLAAAGQRVLFCEKGQSHLAFYQTISGTYPELHGQKSGMALGQGSTELLRTAGRYTDQVDDKSTSRCRRSIPFIGAGTGGSSALYGMALERFHPSDFTPRANHPDASQTLLEDSWPVSYSEFAPYYSAAETLYRVRGALDTLRPFDPEAARLLVPPKLTPGGNELRKFFESKAMHPYRLPMACEFISGCQGCQGYICDRNCKNDSARICLRPALTHHGAVLLDRCEVVAIEADRLRVTGLVCERQGERFYLRGSTIVLASGALQTPNLLLRSTTKDWPDGIANASGMVGRGLMRHFIDLYLIQSEQQSTLKFENQIKEIAFNDFYQLNDVKLGSVQSFGRLPPASMLFNSIRQDVMDGSFPWMASLFPATRPVLMPLLDHIIQNTMAIATTAEDLPYINNKVFLSTSTSRADISLQYQIQPEGHRRIQQFRRLMHSVLKTRKYHRLDQAANNQRIAHVCGTCRFGHNPKTSVLDKNNRVHGLANLYIVDSSFFPSSGGTNPSLTIAANALRVADHLLA